MFENNNKEKINYNALISILIVFLLICIIYFSVIIHYIQHNYNKHLTKFWIDYFITVSLGIIFTIIYIITLFINKRKRSDKYEDLCCNILFISSQSLLLLFFYSIINNSIVDIIESYNIISKIVKFKHVNKSEDLQEISENFREMQLMNDNKENKHLCFIIVINTINLILIFFFL